MTPDNGLAHLRQRMLDDGKTLVVSTYGIHRGFVLLEPSKLARGESEFAPWLDGLERFGTPISLATTVPSTCLRICSEAHKSGRFRARRLLQWGPG